MTIGLRVGFGVEGEWWIRVIAGVGNICAGRPRDRLEALAAASNEGHRTADFALKGRQPQDRPSERG